jgi:large repetitive protein
LGGADTVNVGRSQAALGSQLSTLTTTDVKVVSVDLAAAAGGSDGAADTVVFEGRALDDGLFVSASNAVVQVAGLAYSLFIRNAATADSDLLDVRGNDGNDQITVAPGVSGAIGVRLFGDAGDDVLTGDVLELHGGDGDDLLVGGPGNNLFFGGAGEDTMVGNGGNDTFDGGPDFDTILIRGTSSADRIDLRQDSPTQLRHEIGNPANLFDGVLGGAGTITSTLVIATVEQVRIEAGAGDDIIRVAHDDSLVTAGIAANMLRIDVRGGEPGASDRLTVVDDGLGDTTIQRIGGVPGKGSFTMYAFSGGNPANSIIPLPPVVYTDVEFAGLHPISPVGSGTGADGNGRLFVFKYDPFEQNQSLANATFLGANQTVNTDPVIDPGADLLFGTPGDEDWYRIVAEVTGTLDIQVYFRQQGTLANGRAGLPGDGNLDIALYDADGLVNGLAAPIAGTGAFGTNDATNDERIRIPAVAGQTYYLRVVGAPLPAGDALNQSSPRLISTTCRWSITHRRCRSIWNWRTT